MLVQVIVTHPRWMREYLIYREFGHRSVFGENSLSELTDEQTKLLSLSQLYDVVRNSLDMHDGYEEGDTKTEIPDHILPYPGRLLKWYHDWQEKNRRLRDRQAKSGGKKRGKVVFRDDETDDQAFAAYAAARRRKEAQAKQAKT